MKKVNKILDYLCCIFFSISLIILIGCISVLPIAKSKKYYMKEHTKNDVETILKNETFNGKTHYCTDVNGDFFEHYIPKYDISTNDIENATTHIIDYLYNEDVTSMQFTINTENGPYEFFSEQAIVHMADVKVLFIGGIKMAFTFLAILLICIGYIIYRRNNVFKLLGKTFLITVSVFIVLTIIISIYAITDFDNAFIIFHKVIFPQSDKVDLALSFNNCDTLTNILTSEFFMHIGRDIAIIFISLLVFSVSIDFIFLKFGKNIFSPTKPIIESND